jgi:hypothetical protein
VIFHNAVFTTHGNSGSISFGQGRKFIDAHELYTGFYHSGFERLFPFTDAKMYFAGCNVADGAEGWNFLKAAALTFLRYAGGSALGWTSKGMGVPSWFPLIGGHVEHLWGNVRKVAITPGKPGAGADLHYYELIVEGSSLSSMRPVWKEVSPED